MIEINYPLVLIATFAQFILGALWYSPILFGKTWMKIMENTDSPEQMKKKSKAMTPFYLLQLVLTLFTTINLATLITLLPSFSSYTLAFYILLGFIIPTQIGAVVWANTKKKFWIKQILLMTTYSFVGIMLAAWILGM